MSTRKVTGKSPAPQQKSEAKKPPVRKQQYQLVVAADVAEFTERIEALLADGWVLHGSPLMEGFETSHWHYAQALVRSGKV